MPRLFAETYFRLDPSPDGWFLVQLGVSLVIMFPTTFALGWVFPLVLELAGARRGVAASVGRVYAANTGGTILGAAAGGFLLLPHWGVNATLVAVAAGQALLAAWVAYGVGVRRRTSMAGLCVASAIALVVLRPSWDVLLMNSGVYVSIQDIDRKAGWRGYLERVRKDNQLVYARDGLTSSVLVGFQPLSDNLYLAVNGKTDASSREDLETQIVLGHLPLLAHPDPQRVLVIGLASGISTREAELVQDLIDRWATLDPEDRLDLARRLLIRLDPDGAQTQTALLNDANALIALQHWLGGIR